jgi:hypothetical protein
MAGDDKGPMQDPRTTRQVIDAAPKAKPPSDDNEPEASPAKDSTAPIDTGQEDA